MKLKINIPYQKVVGIPGMSLMVINEYPYRNTHIGINDFTEYQLTQENKIERVFNPHDFKYDNF